MPPGTTQSIRSETISSPLVGRELERIQLREQLAAAFGGQGRLVLVSGEAGIGKTTLARELCQEAAAQGATVLAGHCFDLTATPPYGPWLDLAARYRPNGDLPQLPAALLSGKIDEIESQTELFEEVRDFLTAVSSARPAVMVIEDLHWADPASLDLLRSVALRLSSMPLLVVVTYRVDELTRRHPFYHQLPGLVRDAEGRRIDLHRLTASDFEALISARWQLDQADQMRLVEYLGRHADGNPFFATELLRTLEEEGLLSRVNNGWTLAQLDHIVIPPLLQQVIDGRIARLGEEMRQPLAMAAVIGQEAPLALWSRVTGIELDPLLSIVEQAVEAHLFEAARDGTRVRFVHALTREALYDSILPPRRREWHRQVGELLAANADANPDGVAYHFQEAGDERASEWLIRAGERAQRAYAWATATERFLAAAELLNGVPGMELTRGWLLYRCGRLQRFSNAAGNVEAMSEAERLAWVAGDATLAADAVYSRGLLACYAGDFRRGLVDLIAGIEELETLPTKDALPRVSSTTWMADALPSIDPNYDEEFEPGAAELWAQGMHHRRSSIPWHAGLAGRLEEAEEEGKRFAAIVDHLDKMGGLIRGAAGHTHHGLGIVAASQGRLDEARMHLALARRHYELLEHHACIAFTYLVELRDAVMVFDTTNMEARQHLATGAETAFSRASGALPPGLSPKRPWLGIQLLEGNWYELQEIARDTKQHGNYFFRREVHDTIAPLARYQGEPDHAWVYIRYALLQGTATEPGGMVFVEGLFMQRLAAALELDQGNLGAARRWLEANDRWLAWNACVIGRADNRSLWARYHRANQDIDQAHECAKRAVNLAESPRQPLALLEALRTLGECEIAAGNTKSADEHLVASLALADACAAPFERALTLLAKAELRLATGDLAGAQALAAEARGICVPLEATPTIAKADDFLARATSVGASAGRLPARLTQREVEVLRLVASGLTDAGVAERLFISPRTVSQHLQSIYSKLNVSTRSAATRFAVEHGLT
jgi:DNA-binding CsgD family transcriptional regulator/tetratricopeptide (TPR) repeat protein